MSNDIKLKSLLKKELRQHLGTHKDQRKSAITKGIASKPIEEDNAPNESITIILSTQKWIRCIKRHGVDFDNLNYKSGDSYYLSAQGVSSQYCVLLDNKGKIYSLLPKDLPCKTQGDPLSSKIKMDSDANIIFMAFADKDATLSLITRKAKGFITPFNNCYPTMKTGKKNYSCRR